MSSGELVGVILTAALAGAVVGSVITAVAAVLAGRGLRGQRLVDAWADWLAARQSLTRTTASLIAAFRAMAQEPDGSRYMVLRREEAQRARADWAAAARDLDRAEASLMTQVGDPSIRDVLRWFARPHPDGIRSAINGTQRQVDELLQGVRDADRRATEYVLRQTAILRRPPSALRRRTEQVMGFLAGIVDQWASPPR